MPTPLESSSRVREEPPPDLVRLVRAYRAELEERRAVLLADRADYVARLTRLAECDPHDFSGLARLYTQHLEHIDGLLDAFECAA